VPRADASTVFTPGSELRASFTSRAHPIAYGYGRETGVFRTNLPVYDLPRRWLTTAYCTSCLTGPIDVRHVVMTWGGEADMVISGGMRGAGELAGMPAVLAVPLGDGQVISYNFNGIHRDMNRGDYRLVWNAIMNWNALPRP
jgi:hypothetical protein